MLEPLKTAAAGWSKLSARGRTALIIFSISLFLISLIDAYAIIIFSKLARNDLQNTLKTDPRYFILNSGFILSLFVLKSTFVVIVTWFSSMRLSKEEVYIGSQNFKSYLQMPWVIQQNERSSNLFVAVDKGPFVMTQQFLATIATLASEFVNCLFIIGVIFLYSPQTAVITTIFFVTTSIFQHKLLSKTAAKTGQKVAHFQQATHDVLEDAFQLRKVLKVMPSRSLESHLSTTREKLATSRAHAQFLEALPRFMMETMLVLGIAVVGIVSYASMGSNQIIGTLGIFALASFRILPSLNRIQGLTLSLFGKTALAKQSLPVKYDPTRPIPKIPSVIYSKTIVKLNEVTFKYPTGARPALKNISLNFERGKRYAFVGPSGAGKSTLMEILMGLLEPSSGSLTWFADSDDKFSYVPQDIQVSTTSLQNNVALEWDESEANSKKVANALLNSSLITNEQNLLTNSAFRFDTISGGEKQRLGIARALYRDASIIFLDEPTSSLDTSTENEVMKAISNLSGNRTIFIIAHRLSTVQNVDYVLYLENGEMLGFDTFDSLRRKIPNFEAQIQLASIANLTS